MKISKKINKIKEFFLDLIFPRVCLVCAQEGFYLCNNCLEKIPLTNKFVCPGCKKISLYGRTCKKCKRKIALDGLIYASSYQNFSIREAIRLLKYEYVKELSKELAKVLIKMIKNSHFLTNNFSEPISLFLVVPIPLHHKKYLFRGFNQAELIAEVISKEFDLNLKTDLLIKKKNTPSQTDLKEKERLINLKDAFKIINKKEVKGKIIFLIDDVATTGATLNEAARVLKKSGAKEVWGMTVACG